MAALAADDENQVQNELTGAIPDPELALIYEAAPENEDIDEALTLTMAELGLGLTADFVNLDDSESSDDSLESDLSEVESD